MWAKIWLSIPEYAPHQPYGMKSKVRKVQELEGKQESRMCTAVNSRKKTLTTSQDSITVGLMETT
jgi:hypothetical protein